MGPQSDLGCVKRNAVARALRWGNLDFECYAFIFFKKKKRILTKATWKNKKKQKLILLHTETLHLGHAAGVTTANGINIFRKMVIQTLTFRLNSLPRRTVSRETRNPAPFNGYPKGFHQISGLKMFGQLGERLHVVAAIPEVEDEFVCIFDIAQFPLLSLSLRSSSPSCPGWRPLSPSARRRLRDAPEAPLDWCVCGRCRS